ncbi:hypothetical protein BJ138DRAFT_1086229 [Hygrophoropsis aurantiaca]|uniref:Uncharacterized protein n=1 Tax=Hygrophoropsis aurantiaca TaxID=72124 RepID=A0ACB8AEB6_9AGAM|nr:hypothetical protein BJ138DRAFT_1086229 [Hygrophoropsis aurantiaca]
MAVSTHSIHSIHGTFSGIPSYSRHASQSLYTSHAGVVIERSIADRYPPPGLPKTVWRAAPVSLPSSGSANGRRLPILRNHRRPPPPPPYRAPPAQSIPFPSEDPFNDMNALVPTSSMDIIPYPRTHLASLSQSYTVRLPQHHPIHVFQRQKAAQDSEKRSKFVAGTLLNRVHAVGKPMRRMPPTSESPRPYKRSGLSRMISAEDL